MAEKFTARKMVAAGVLTTLGALTTGCETTQYETIHECDTVDDRLTTTGSKVDGARLLFGDGNITQVPDDKYFIHTQKFKTVEVEAEEYMEYPIGSEYCEDRSIPVEPTEK